MKYSNHFIFTVVSQYKSYYTMIYKTTTLYIIKDINTYMTTDYPPMPTSSPPRVESALYVVATPIGNLWDMSYRAVAMLQGVDVIFCEDTRTSATLLHAFQIHTKTVSYHDHNGHIQRPKILKMLQNGMSIALISDAGTPLINDPGYKLVHAVVQAGYKVVPIPGVSAPITALMAAGMPSDVFTYLGFLPHKSTAKRNFLKKLRPEQGTIIVFDTPRRLGDTLCILRQDMPDCMVVVAREMTKKFEHFTRLCARDITDDIIQSIPTKGECVLLLRYPEKNIDINIDALLVMHMREKSLKDAVHIVADISQMPKKTIYKHALQIKKQWDT